MVRGLDKFKDYFGAYRDSFVIIGGTALSLEMGESGLDFRVTKDIDIVLQVESLSKEFINAFWDFIKAGGYKNIQKSTGKRLFYRFDKPSDESFPYMIELFSRKPDKISLRGKSHLTPIPASEDLSSLSAILLDDDYYSIMTLGKIEVNGLPVVSAEYLIPLKAKAWLDLTALKRDGAPIDEKDIRKHRNDVFRLVQLVSPDRSVQIPDKVLQDLLRFVQEVREKPVDLKDLGIRNLTFTEALDIIKTFFRENVKT